MKNFVFFLMLSFFVFNSCEKNEPEPIEQISSITFVCQSNNAYDIFINDGFKSTVMGNSSSTVVLTPGSYSYKLVQKNGYLLTPSIFTGYSYLDPGDTKTIKFPK